jgi:AraC-like DNA-binding protein
MEKLAYFLQIVTTISSAIFAIVFLFYNWNKSVFKKLLAVQFLVISYGLFINFLAINNFFSYFPHLSRTGLLCAFLIQPIQFLAIYKSFTDKKFHWLDVLHFLPAVLYIANFYNYFILSTSEKIVILESNSVARFAEGFLPDYFLPIFSIFQTTFYILWFGFLLKKIKKEISSKTVLYFIYFMMIYMVFHFLPPVMVVLYYYDTHSITSWMPVIYAAVNLMVFFKILATPEWLFYHKPSTVEVSAIKPTTTSRQDPSLLELRLITMLSPKKIQFNIEENRLFERFTEAVEADQFFLLPNFSQKNVAEKLDVSEYKIRLIVEKAYGIKFSEFSNYRKTYFLLNEMRKNPQWKKYSFVAIARKLGYLSTNSFYLNFKRISGVTPKEYFDSLGD